MSARQPVDYTTDNLLKRPGGTTGIYSDDVTVIVTIAGNQWYVVEGEVNTSNYKQSDALKMKVVRDKEDNPNALIFPGNDIAVDIFSSSVQGLDDGNRNMVNPGNESVRIFTGKVATAIDMGDQSFDIKAFTSEVDLIATKVPLASELPTKLTKLVELIIKSVNAEIDTDIEFNVDIESYGTKYGMSLLRSHPVADEINDTLTADEYKPTSAAKLLEFIGRKTNATWWFDSRNVFQFGNTKTTNHKLTFVTDTTAGKSTPPYNAVKVIGDNIASRQGWDSRNMISEEFAVSEETLDTIGTPESIATFVYRDDSIKTQQQADNTAKQILDELQTQQAEGSVTVVGYPLVKKFDVIEMPDSFGNAKFETVAPAQYAVSGVTHRFSPSDGYVTEIECAGIVGRYSGPQFEITAPTEEGGETQIELVNEGDEATRDETLPNDGLPPQEDTPPRVDR